MVFWLYGRSGAGKTTLANRLAAELDEGKPRTFVLDGDEMRIGLCRDLGFAEADRNENHRRVAEVSKLLSERGLVVIVATMAPQHAQRSIISDVLRTRVHWVYVDASYEACARRDNKGLYRRAASGELADFQDFGFDLPYSEEVGLRLDTEKESVAESYRRLRSYVVEILGV